MKHSPENTKPEQEAALPHNEKKDYTELAERLASIIKQISGKQDVTVTTKLTPRDRIGLLRIGHDPDTTWFQRDIIDPKTKKVKGALVHIPEKILETHENVAKGKAAHEAGHAAITRMGRFVPDTIMQELGFHQLLLATEELPTDQVVRDRYEGAGTWVDQARKDSAVEGELLHRTRGTLGYIPKSSQLNNLVVYARQYEKIPERYDPDVVELYRKLKPTLDRIEYTFPPEDAAEEEIIERSKERYNLIYTRLWPEVQKLTKKDIETEKLRQILTTPPESESTKKQPEDDIIEKAMRDVSESLGATLKKELDTLAVPGDSPKKPIPIDQLSEELLRRLREAYERLPEHIKKTLEERARKILEQIEDDFIKEIAPKLANGGETHEEYNKRMAEGKVSEKTKKDRREKQSEIDDEIREIEDRLASMPRANEIYEATYQEIRELDEALYKELESVFTPNIKRTMKLRSSGSKINLPAVFRWEASRKGGAKQPDNKIFETTYLPEKKDYVITLLNDLSGSMAEAGKVEEDFKAKILLTEVLNRLGIKNEILGFQDEIITFKRFDEELDDEIRKKIAGIPLEVLGKNPDGHNYPGNNDDGPCLREASQRLHKESGKEKFLIVISDGYPTGPYEDGNNGERKTPDNHLHEAVEHVIKNTDQKLIGLGLGQDTEHVKDFYPTAIPNISVKKLVETLSGLLKDMIINPQKYSYKDDHVY